MKIPKKYERIPSTVCICIDRRDVAGISGRLYHYNRKEAMEFQTIVGVMKLIEQHCDEIGYPQATVRIRSFVSQEDAASDACDQPVSTLEEITAHAGQLDTFLVCVETRVNASWQGSVLNLTSGREMSFSSDLEMLDFLAGKSLN